MKKKILVVAAVLFALFLMQASVVYAKPTLVAFGIANPPFNFVVDESQTVELERTIVTHAIGHGEMTGDILGPFTFTDTITIYKDSTGATRSMTHVQLIEITTASGNLVVEAKQKWVASGTPLLETTGTWKILYGTGLMGAVTGGGTYYPWFTFEGIVK